ncbi:MAPEG family protein [Sphingopyxis sp. SE2]|uniref:MAPEG family protein n=1 Tax=unclassified Sphingopyxis TaxID=2614943 RepID=UPI0028BFE1D6|nr:MAPEG family protein [Sphingopyxis sp. SE2]MDT7529951.1 MAPEG family protein [Sphingopyxis sp. SE2]
MDLETEQRQIRKQSKLAFCLCAAISIGCAVFLPKFIPFPTEVGARLAFAIQTSAVHFAVVVVAVRLVSSGRYRSAADIGGAAKGPPSPELAIKIAFLQNTLEQAFLGVGAHLTLASIAGGRWLALLIASDVLFVIGRLSFYRCYSDGAGARAFGMATTALAALICYLAAGTLLIGRLFGG